MKEREFKKKKNRLGLLSKVQSPDDLEIGELVKPEARGSEQQLMKEESPDDLETQNYGRKNQKQN